MRSAITALATAIFVGDSIMFDLGIKLQSSLRKTYKIIKVKPKPSKTPPSKPKLTPSFVPQSPSKKSAQTG
jgi:hypothetical protein